MIKRTQASRRSDRGNAASCTDGCHLLVSSGRSITALAKKLGLHDLVSEALGGQIPAVGSGGAPPCIRRRPGCGDRAARRKAMPRIEPYFRRRPGNDVPCNGESRVIGLSLGSNFVTIVRAAFPLADWQHRCK